MFNVASVQSPVLVNRGWVPRSWRERDNTTGSRQNGKQSHTDPASVQKSASPWWKFWSKKPTRNEVVLIIIVPGFLQKIYKNFIIGNNQL